MADLGPLLEAAARAQDVGAGIARDPVRFVHRYSRPEDQEIAAVFASQLAYGRVDQFGAVLERLFGILDRRGGPRAFVDDLDPASAAELGDLLYRLNRPSDWVGMAAGLQELFRTHRTLEAAFAGDRAEDFLGTGVSRLTAAIERAAPRFEVELPLRRGLGHWLAQPARGSACKRWNLFARWMVRRPDGVDLGIWDKPARGLVIPLDTHVYRVSGFLGLTTRKSADWRTAVEITRGLAAMDPEDPVRFDFALAHLGISGACRARPEPEICPSCPLVRGCTIGARLAR